MDIEEATRVEAGRNGGFIASLTTDYFHVRPAGGYLLALALRAAAASTDLVRPASMSAHFLGAGDEGPCNLDVATLRRSRRAHSLQVVIEQDGQQLMRALLWFTDPDRAGLTHDFAVPPAPSATDAVLPVQERARAEGMELAGLHDHFECRWTQREVSSSIRDRTPTCEGWHRFLPPGPFEPAITDDGRALFVLDYISWAAAIAPHSEAPFGHDLPVVGASLDFNATFHRRAATPWLFARAECPIAGEGLHGVVGQLFDEHGKLCLSSVSTLVGLRG